MWCSWCFKKEKRRVLQENKVTRNVLQCIICKSECCVCMKCTDATARRYPDGSDKLCYKCSHVIKEWKDSKELMEELSVKGRCSWCFQTTSHSLFRHKTLSRSTYLCSGCTKDTVKCRKCDSFARGYSIFSDQLCLSCDGTITDWDKPLETATKPICIDAWCSWCMERTEHELEKITLMRRDFFRCKGCSTRTLTCKTKGCTEGMTRGEEAWTDHFCVQCELLADPAKKRNKLTCHETWERMREAKMSIFEALRGKETVVESLQLKTKWRDEAQKAGLERPFLLLVGMDPVIRCRVAAALGFSLYMHESFGTPHKEAHHILFRDRMGMVFRSDQSYEKLNPLAHSSTWYQMVRRVLLTVLHQERENLSHSEAFEASCKPGNERMNKLEVDCLVRIASIPISKANKRGQEPAVDHDEVVEDIEATLEEVGEDGHPLSVTGEKLPMQKRETSADLTEGEAMDEARAALEEFADENCSKEELEEAVDDVRKLLARNTGIQREDLVMYSVRLSLCAASVTGVSQAVILGTATLIAPAAIVTLGASLMGVLATPLIFISVIGLAGGAIKMGFGSSEGRLVWPVAMILNQRLLLALDDINMEDYLTPLDLTPEEESAEELRSEVTGSEEFGSEEALEALDEAIEEAKESSAEEAKKYELAEAIADTVDEVDAIDIERQTNAAF